MPTGRYASETFAGSATPLGTVEEIGIRSTRIRTLDHTIVSVPNAEFSKARLENYAARRKIWHHPRIRLPYETSPDQVRYLLVEIGKLLHAHPKVLPDPPRIRFTELGEYSLNLDVFAYIETADYTEYLEIAEDLNLSIMDLVKSAGTHLALPAQIEHQVASAPLDQASKRQAEARVQEWRAQGALYLPKIPVDKIVELRKAVDHPQSGSSGRGTKRTES